MPLIAKSDLSTGNIIHASYLLCSASLHTSPSNSYPTGTLPQNNVNLFQPSSVHDPLHAIGSMKAEKEFNQNRIEDGNQNQMVTFRAFGPGLILFSSVLISEKVRSIRRRMSCGELLRSADDRDDRGWTMLHVGARKGNMKEDLVIAFCHNFDLEISVLCLSSIEDEEWLSATVSASKIMSSSLIGSILSF